jgi:hypothetical protein
VSGAAAPTPFALPSDLLLIRDPRACAAFQASGHNQSPHSEGYAPPDPLKGGWIVLLHDRPLLFGTRESRRKRRLLDLDQEQATIATLSNRQQANRQQEHRHITRDIKELPKVPSSRKDRTAHRSPMTSKHSMTYACIQCSPASPARSTFSRPVVESGAQRFTDIVNLPSCWRWTLY